jgi:S-methylmethionine-dependent homocysteine/selenocysteine methylase
MVAVMHCDLDVSDAAVKIAAEAWDGPLVVYPNSGEYERPHWRFDTVCPPEEFVEHAEGWIADGADIIGGCCGVGPEHIRLLAERLGATTSY